jgi:flagellar assembly factor FliW
MVNPFLLIEDYEIEISEETVVRLEIENAEDVSLYSILTIPENVEEITANLLAPIVINTANNKAAQEILNDERYSIKHKLYRGE